MDSVTMIGIGSGIPPTGFAVGQALHFTSGQFTGQDIRIELQELQKAEVGRKYANVDRRPLDPPPVVRLRLFRIHHFGSVQEHEEEIFDYRDFRNIGIVCTVDLFPIAETVWSASLSAPPSELLNADCQQHDSRAQTERVTDYTPSILTSDGNPWREDTSVLKDSHQNPPFCTTGGPLTDIVHQRKTHLNTESSNLTRALVGERFTEPVHVNYMGEEVLVFVFGDLAVRREGTFTLHYRVFDIFSSVAGAMPIQAELYGGAFKVYSTRTFPGLLASTELTKTEPARIIRVGSVDERVVNQKLRLVGRLLAYDSQTCLVLLLEDECAVLVDVSLCIGYQSSSWVRDYLGTIRVIGHLEATAELPIPTIPTYAFAPVVNPKLVIRAILVEGVVGMDMSLWKRAIEERVRTYGPAE